MSAKPIIQGQEFPVITPTAIKDLDEIPAEVDKNRVHILTPRGNTQDEEVERLKLQKAQRSRQAWERNKANPAEDQDHYDEKLTEVTQLDGSTDTAASFQFEGEDHTLGNVLRYIIMKNPDVEFCGYSIPHPSEAKMNIRIQSYDGASVWDILEKGLQDLMEMCDVVTDKFVLARDEHRADRIQS